MEILEKKILANVFFNKTIMKNILSFLEDESKLKLKTCFKRSGHKEKKKKIKEIMKNYLIDFGKHQEKIKFKINEEGKLIMNTNIFNINKCYLKEMLGVYHNDTDEEIVLEKEDLYGYLKVLPKFDFFLTNARHDRLKLTKAIIPYDCDDDNDSIEEINDEKKYEMFYNMNEMDINLPVDFSNKEYLIERQKRILEIINSEKNKIFYPLEFILNVSYWTIILCNGGYFACGFFLKDKIMDHKSDHKYVTRKKAGQRQVTKDKSKNTKSSIGAQIRRENEKKHQENIEYLLKINEEYLIKSDVIFLQAPGINKSILIGDTRPLTSFKKKIINIPFNVQRANYTYMMEIYEKLTNCVLEINDINIKKLLI